MSKLRVWITGTYQDSPTENETIPARTCSFPTPRRLQATTGEDSSQWVRCGFIPTTTLRQANHDGCGGDDGKQEVPYLGIFAGGKVDSLMEATLFSRSTC